MALQKALLTPAEKQEYFFKFNVDSLLRGDYQSRMNGYAIGIQNGFLSSNDVRRLEDMNDIPDELGGNLYRTNGNMVPLTAVGAWTEKYKE
jgi:phage portal protein BeeE